jgi:hypothetical protein
VKPAFSATVTGTTRTIDYRERLWDRRSEIAATRGFRCPPAGEDGAQFHGLFEDAYPRSYHSQTATLELVRHGLARRHLNFFSNCGDPDTASHVTFNNSRVGTCLIIRHTEEATYHTSAAPN